MEINYDKLKKTQKMILSDVANVCDEYQLKYYLIGGTLLGAIRHKGFIPWDDDIDLGMPRDDYDELFSILSKEYQDKYFVQRFETDRNYTRYIMKVRLLGTLQKEEVNEKIDMNQGIYIDIFPLDEICDNKKELIKRGKQLRCLFAMKNIKHHTIMTTKIKKVGSFFIRMLLYFISDYKIDEMFKRVCEKDNGKSNALYMTSFASHYGWKRQMVPKEYYGDGIMVEFENELFRAPSKYELILVQLFGKDYMNIPPKEMQIQHKLVQVDFGKY